jgi:hypothetical protein
VSESATLFDSSSVLLLGDLTFNESLAAGCVRVVVLADALWEVVCGVEVFVSSSSSSSSSHATSSSLSAAASVVDQC